MLRREVARLDGRISCILKRRLSQPVALAASAAIFLQCRAALLCSPALVTRSVAASPFHVHVSAKVDVAEVLPGLWNIRESPPRSVSLQRVVDVWLLIIRRQLNNLLRNDHIAVEASGQRGSCRRPRAELPRSSPLVVARVSAVQPSLVAALSTFRRHLRRLQRSAFSWARNQWDD